MTLLLSCHPGLKARPDREKRCSSSTLAFTFCFDHRGQDAIFSHQPGTRGGHDLSDLKYRHYQQKDVAGGSERTALSRVRGVS
jgi:hypothetical protein